MYLVMVAKAAKVAIWVLMMNNDDAITFAWVPNSNMLWGWRCIVDLDYC